MVHRANDWGSRSFAAKAYSGRITLFLARDDPVMEMLDRRSRWGELATGHVEVYEVPGNQTAMLREPQVTFLAEQLKACLDE